MQLGSPIIDPRVKQLTLDERVAMLATIVSEQFRMMTVRIQALETDLLNLSQAMAEKEHGKERVSNAIALAKAEDKLKDFCAKPHPYDELVSWYISQG